MPAKITKLHEDKPRSPWPYMPGPHDPSRDFEDATFGDEPPPPPPPRRAFDATTMGWLFIALAVLTVPWLVGMWQLVRMLERVLP